MKRVKQWIAPLIIVLLLGATTHISKGAPAQAGVSFSVFYDNLSPYGQWISDPAYGYVWVPDVAAGFRPYYTNGYWVMTEYGNTWVSSYAWGWAPFHYGRWVYNSFYGWMWVPDTVWGPAWVCWRTGGGYYGWAPLSPGISVSASFGNYYPPYDWWIFVPPTYVYNQSFYRHVHHPRNQTFIQQTTIINNTYYNNKVTYVSGPRRQDVEKITKRPVPVYAVGNLDKPRKPEMQNNKLLVYKPAVSPKTSKMAPANVKRSEQPIGKPQPATNNKGTPNVTKEPIKNNSSKPAVVPNQKKTITPSGNQNRNEQNPPAKRGVNPGQRRTMEPQKPAMQQPKQQPQRIAPNQPRQFEQRNKQGVQQPQQRIEPNQQQPQRINPQQQQKPDFRRQSAPPQQPPRISPQQQRQPPQKINTQPRRSNPDNSKRH